MTRILQAMAGAEHGGAEAFFERLTIALQRADMDQHVLIRSNPNRAALLRDHGVRVTELPFGGQLDVATHWGFRRAIAKTRPQVVLTWMNRATRFCPRGDFVHAARLGGYYDMKYYRGCDHLIGNTQDICDWIIGQSWDPARVHYLPNFVDETRLPPVSRATFSTPAGAPLIVTLGRLHGNKAFDVLIRAMVHIPDAYVWIAGEGPLLGELEKLASHLGVISRLRFLGWRSDVAALLAAADLFVCPSRHEPLGNVVLEAWAQGVPVVAAASQGPSQLIADGKNGLLSPVDDAQAMAQAVNRLLADRDLAAALGAAGRQSFCDTFTESAVVARYTQFFASVCG